MPLESIILNEDCRETIKNHLNEISCVITSPPDFEEVGMNPEKDFIKYFDFLKDVFLPLNNKTIIIVITDRRHGGKIFEKHCDIIRMFDKELRMDVIDHKIWIKSLKINLFRLNYSHVMIFMKRGTKGTNKHLTEYRPDAFEFSNEKYGGYNYGFPKELIDILIENFTNENDLVYDPFMGSGTVGVSAIRTKRKYLGSEINVEYCKLAKERISKLEEIKS